MTIREQAIKVVSEYSGLPCVLTLADTMLPDSPLIYVNEQFEDLTGFDRTEILGRNCRFLQGEETDQTAVRKLKQSIETGTGSYHSIINYKKNGEKFYNFLSVIPIFEGQESRIVLGCQYEFKHAESDIEIRAQVEKFHGVVSHIVRPESELFVNYLYSTSLKTDSIALMVSSQMKMLRSGLWRRSTNNKRP